MTKPALFDGTPVPVGTVFRVSDDRHMVVIGRDESSDFPVAAVTEATDSNTTTRVIAWLCDEYVNAWLARWAPPTAGAPAAAAQRLALTTRAEGNGG